MSQLKTIQDIVRLALEKEQEAVQFYTQAAQLVANPGTKVMLKELAEEEQKHVSLLSKVQTGSTLKMIGSRPLPASMDFSRYLVSEPVSENSTPQDIMIIAIKREDSAIAFYSQQLEVFAGNELRETFERLLAWEKEHKERLEAEYDREVLKDN